jgi:Ca2+-binding EF-hand superfamily protein
LQSLSTFCEQGRKEERRQQRLADRLVEDKQKRFTSMSEKEQKDLRLAFDKCCAPGSNVLGPSECSDALAELGIVAKTKVEQHEFERICDNAAEQSDHIDFFGFCFELLPRVRQRLCELHQASLLHEFNLYDKDRSGELDEWECRQLLETFCTGNLDSQCMVSMERWMDEALKHHDHRIDFNVFQSLVGRAREHHQRIIRTCISKIKTNHGLEDTDIQQHSDEIVILHEGFRNADRNGHSQLQWDEVVTALIEYGLFPHDMGSRMHVLRLFKKVDTDDDGKLGFREYLRLIRSIRDKRMEQEEQNLRDMFHRLDKDQSSRLDIMEISTLLGELGIQPRCHEDQWEIKRLLDDIDVDRSGNLSFEQFAALIQRLQGRLSVALRRRQQVLAHKSGLDGRQLTELRILFFDLDRDAHGFLTAQEQREAIRRLTEAQQQEAQGQGGSAQHSQEHLSRVAAEIDAASATGIGRVDFQGFLQRFGVRRDPLCASDSSPPNEEAAAKMAY